MIAGSPQWNGQAQAIQPWQNVIEPVGVFECEHARQEIFIRVEVIERCLHTCQMRWPLPKRYDGFFELVGIGAIFRIVNHQVFAPRKKSPTLQALGFVFG